MEVKKNPNVDISKMKLEFGLVGTIFVLAFCIIMFSFTTFKKDIKKKKIVAKSDDTEVIDNTDHKKAPPPPPPPPTLQIVDNNVETKETLESTEFEPDKPVEEILPTSTGNGEEKEKIVEEKIYERVEQMPEFLTGDDGLNDFLNENVEYPQAEKDDGIEGTVNVYFIVDENGNVIDVNTNGPQTSPPPAKALMKAAITAVEKMKESKMWKPGFQSRKAVKVKCVVPITFSVEEE